MPKMFSLVSAVLNICSLGSSFSEDSDLEPLTGVMSMVKVMVVVVCASAR